VDILDFRVDILTLLDRVDIGTPPPPLRNKKGGKKGVYIDISYIFCAGTYIMVFRVDIGLWWI